MLRLSAPPAILISACLPALAAAPAVRRSGRVLRVGERRPFRTVRAAARACRDGDVIEIDAGLYKGDVCEWRRNDLVVRGVGGMAHLDADGKHEGGKGTFVVYGHNFTVENIEFSGSRVPHRNGSGIRAQGRGLVVRNCYFHDNENGILGGGGSRSDVVIEYCEFARNGHGDGYSHNMYISHVRSFTLRFTYSHHAKVGHNVKSRAAKNIILYNRIMDEADGRSSYTVDLPNGGFTVMIGNLLQQGPKTDNSAIFAYAAEGGKNSDQRLYVVNNTFVNDRARGDFIRVRSCSGGLVANNIFLGDGGVRAGKAELKNNLTTADSRIVVDRKTYDYRLAAAAAAAVNRGIDPGKVGEFALAPIAQYLHKARREERFDVGGARDIGAYEFGARQAALLAQAAKKGRSKRTSTARKPRGDPLAGRRDALSAAAVLAGKGDAEGAAGAYKEIASKLPDGRHKAAVLALAEGSGLRGQLIRHVIRGIKEQGAKRVMVDFFGSPQRMKIIDADEKQGVFGFGGDDVSITWETFPPRRLAGIASRYAASAGDHLDIARYAAACGENKTAAKALERAGEAGLEGTAVEVARALEAVLKQD